MRTPTTEAPKFDLGQIVATPNAMTYADVHHVDVTALLWRHITGDWGDGIDPEDAATNDWAVEHGGRILSAYGPGDSGNVAGLWIITEADRSVTTILRPEDY